MPSERASQEEQNGSITPASEDQNGSITPSSEELYMSAERSLFETVDYVYKNIIITLTGVICVY